MSLIRGTSLQGFPELVTELGGDPDALLAAAHIPLAAVGNQDSFISTRSVIAVVESAAVVTSAPDFGRQLALRQGLEILGPVGVAVRTAPTVGAALQAADQYMSVYSPGLSTYIDLQPAERHARFVWQLLDARIPSHRQAAELGLGVALQVFRLLVGPDFRPLAVHLPHEQLTSTRNYMRYFGCPIRFSSSYAGFLVRRSDLARPLSSDSAVHEVVRGYLSSIAPPVGGQTVEPVRLLIRRMLLTGGLDLDLVAAHLALHPRTLQRQLAAQGTSFAGLVDEVRRSETERYLVETDLALSQLAGILGYSEQSVLSRSCQRWFGMSASAYRRHLTATQVAG
jgi:AraC-like DNA-binding protein